jgi:DNA-binding response OmpR family regulator
VEDERHKLRRDVERYRFLVTKIANPALTKVLDQMRAEAETRLASFEASSRTNPQHARSSRISGGADASRVNPANSADRERLLQIDDWKLDPQTRTATAPAGKTVQLTQGEFELLRALVTHANQTLSRTDLIALSGNHSAHANERTIDVLIGRLRHKLEVNPRHPRYINTLRNLGYIFRTQAVTMTTHVYHPPDTSRKAPRRVT